MFDNLAPVWTRECQIKTNSTAVTNVSKDHSVFIFRAKQCKNTAWTADPHDKGTTIHLMLATIYQSTWNNIPEDFNLHSSYYLFNDISYANF
jgi:hypothetical protein